jgi:hypothetical protein
MEFEEPRTVFILVGVAKSCKTEILEWSGYSEKQGSN